MNPYGATLVPQICYFTTDTAATYSNVIVAAQRNDAFQTANSYTLYGNNVASGTGDTVISVLSASQQAIFRDTSIHNYYKVAGTFCNSNNITSLYLLGYAQYSALTVDSTTSGYPQLTWPLQFPVTYTSIYVLAREQGSAWQVIDSLFGITGTNLQVTYVDHYPTSTHMDYMLGYNLNNTCDPARSSPTTAFTNSARGVVRSALVTTRPSGPNGITSLTSETFLDLHPNPVTRILHIQLVGTANPATIAVYDMLGHVVYSTEIHTEQVAVDMSGYAQGVYLVKATQQSKVIAIKKVVKD